MTTVSSTTSSTASIVSTLGAGSGIDTASLVTNLVSATYDPKLSALSTKEAANTAKVSSLGTISNGIDAFASALTTLIAGGTLFTQPTSSDASVVTATAKAGAAIGGLSAQLQVRQLAQAQSLVSGYFPSAAATVGSGGLTLTVGGVNYDIGISSSSASLAGIARAINARNVGVTASVVTDANGARLALKGTTGAANSFTLAATPNSDAGLAKLGFGASGGLAASGTALVSGALAASTDAVGQGTLTLNYGGADHAITIDGSNDSLDGLAAAINAQGLGLTAAVVTDAAGARLSLTDGSGAVPAATLTPAATAQAGLGRFAWPATSGSALTQVQGAQDAIVRLDGVDVTRSSNTVDDLVDGVTLKLLAAAPTQTVTLGAERPTAAIKQAVGDFVDAYNLLKGELDTATSASVTAADGTTAPGPLYGNAGIRNMRTQLARLTSTVLSTSGGVQTLAEVGVSTNRDGTLSLDSDQLAAALARDPDGVEALFNPTQHSSSPLIKITSALGAAKPGSYQLTGIVAATGSTNAAGSIAGVVAAPGGNGQLYASVASPASGLQIQPAGDVASATVTVDLGLGGALKAIRDQLQSTSGIFASLTTQFASEKSTLATQRTTLEDAEGDYRTRLTNQFATMDSAVAAFKATQSYLTQQIALWTKSN